MASKIQIVVRVMVYLLAILSFAAGIPKILQLPQELGFLGALGLSGFVVSILGVVQLAGGMMLLWSRSRVPGALLAGFALLVSSAAIFAGGDAMFGLASLIPILAMAMVIYVELKRVRGNAA